MKLKNGLIFAFSLMGLLIIFLIIFTMINRFWIGSVEKNLLEFLASAKEDRPRKLHEILTNFNVSEYEYACTLGPYQMTVDYKNEPGDAPDWVYGEISSNLNKINYRKGFWGLLNSEAHWALILFNKKLNTLRADEISNNRIPLILRTGGGGCFSVEKASVAKAKNDQYPYGYGISFISNDK